MRPCYDILPIVTPGPAHWRHDVALALEPLPPHYREMVLLHDLERPTTAGRNGSTSPRGVNACTVRWAFAREFLDP